MSKLLEGRTGIVTGAAQGLGRAHALALARAGARLVVNDLSAEAAAAVCEEIAALGGEALPAPGSVTDAAHVDAMAAAALARFGKIDFLVNNAGILRDKSFAKADLADFRLVLEVHLMGSVICTRAVWPHMREAGHGRIVFTTSSSGLYGNFGQSAYSAAKMALVGLMQTLALEGERSGIHVNCVAPSAATQMTGALLPPEDLADMSPEWVSPAIVALVSAAAPTKRIVLAGAGSFEEAHVTMTQGLYVGNGPDAAEVLLSNWSRLGDRTDERVPATGFEQYKNEVAQARRSRSGG